MSVREQLTALDACRDAIKWASAFPTLQAAWDACERGDWMLWLVGRLDTSEPYSDERKPLARCCLEVALQAWEQMPKAGRDCIELHERWCAGEALATDDLRAAGAAAYAAGAAGAARALKQSAAIVRRHYPVVPGKE